MSVATIRILIGDINKYRSQTFTGDGSTTRFQVSKYPVITGSASVTVSGTASTAYTVDVDTGVFTFTAPPANGAVIVIAYNYAQLSTETLVALLVIEPNVSAAAAMAADSLAGKYGEISDKTVGDLSISYSQRAVAFRDLAKTLRGRGMSEIAVPYAGGISIADKDSEVDDTDRPAPGFHRELHSYTTSLTEDSIEEGEGNS